MNHEAGIILNLPTLILTPSLRPDKPRIPFEDMDCKVTFKVIRITAMNIIAIMTIIMITAMKIIIIMKIKTIPSPKLEFPTTLEPSQELLGTTLMQVSPSPQ